MSIMERFKLTNKVAIMTGGASGLGKAMADALSEAGAKLVIADLNGEAADRVAKDLEERHGVPAISVEVNVTNEKQVEAMVDKVIKTFGQIDILFNNAGIGSHEKVENMTYETWKKQLDVNLNSMFLVSNAVGKYMRAQNRGVIINTSSMSGIIVNTPQPQAAYNTSKAGVIMFTKSLAIEWAEHGIRVNTIAPGYMKTDLTREYYEDNGDKVKKWNELTPMKRPGTPDELGGLAIYLASDASSFVTGSVFTVDGGYTAQ
ncbi:SDR family oxidoreductase [Bacillus subtilis]|uniref:glucose 1-dehydrogenase n=1 Tax=Bacillus subtilis TaxID=1423 RepID=UPI002E1D146C|nr:SDR family oxidoreductase [Bacillus subtilis]MED3489408.1 SDR family oxidoreductase [Bacillus subtilis]